LRIPTATPLIETSDELSETSNLTEGRFWRWAKRQNPAGDDSSSRKLASAITPDCRSFTREYVKLIGNDSNCHCAAAFASKISLLSELERRRSFPGQWKYLPAEQNHVGGGAVIGVFAIQLLGFVGEHVAVVDCKTEFVDSQL
jgi:hypothetical protein